MREEGKVSKIALLAIALYYSTGSFENKAHVLCDIVSSSSSNIYNNGIGPYNLFLVEVLSAMFDFALVFAPEWHKFINPEHFDPIQKLNF